jgi:integrase
MFPQMKEVITKMVAGHLQEKKGYFHIVLNYADENNKRKTKWVSTGLPVKNNKKKAEDMLLEARSSFVPPFKAAKSGNILFADFMEEWLKVAKQSITEVTYATYCDNVKKSINPYFRKKGILLKDLTAKHIQDFYTEKLEKVSANSVIHYHANIHKALKYAVKMDILMSNPASKVERPKIEKFVGNFYDAKEINALFQAAKGTKLELAILFGAFYGLRRSEVVGLKWNAFDFVHNTITIRHTVVEYYNETNKISAKDRAKNKASLRTLPLVPMFKAKLLELKEKQRNNMKLYKSSYSKEYKDYIYVDELGKRIRPGYITGMFPKFLMRKGLRKIRFHDLRHSAASLLLANGVSMKKIQEWLGHSNFSTTANIYSHLEYISKISSANAMLAGLGVDII